MSDQQRRRFRRFEICIPVTLDSIRARVQNLSLGGANLECEVPLELERHFLLSTDDRLDEPSLSARVVWCQPFEQIYQCGLSFQASPAEVLDSGVGSRLTFLDLSYEDMLTPEGPGISK